MRQSLSYRQQTGDFCVWWPDLNSPRTLVRKQECEIFINVRQQVWKESRADKPNDPPAVWIYEDVKLVSRKSSFLIEKYGLFASTRLKWVNHRFLMARLVRRLWCGCRRRSHASTALMLLGSRTNGFFTAGGRHTEPHASCWGCLESTATTMTRRHVFVKGRRAEEKTVCLAVNLSLWLWLIKLIQLIIPIVTI